MPSERVHEARNKCEMAVLDYGHLVSLDEARDRLDALIAAVRAETLTEVRARVEEMQTYLLSSEMPWEEKLIERKDVFAALTTLEADRGR